MMNLAVSEIMAGANFWDAPGHSMAGSNDLPTRRKIFSWIKANEKTFYSPRSPVTPIGVYFSPQTRNFFARDFVASYRGILILLMQKHLEFQIVTPRTLAGFQGSKLILPDVRLISDGEKALLRTYIGANKVLVVTGDDATGLGDIANVIRFSKCPGKDYSLALQKDFDDARPDQEHEFLESLKSEPAVRVIASSMLATSIARVNGSPHVFFANFAGLRGGVGEKRGELESRKRHSLPAPSDSRNSQIFCKTGTAEAKSLLYPAESSDNQRLAALTLRALDQEHEFLESLKSEPAVRVIASSMLATSIARVNGSPHVFFANFAGLRGGSNPVQTPQTGVEVVVPGNAKGRGFFLPFLGEVQSVDGVAGADGVTYRLPTIQKGAVFWYEP